MKNPKLDFFRRKMREYHRHHPWRLDGGFYIPHEYPDVAASKLSWWGDVGFILNGRRVMVSWHHPRCLYHDAVHQQAMDDVAALGTPKRPSTSPFLQDDAGLKTWRRLGRSRKKVVCTRWNPRDEWRVFWKAITEREDELTRAGIDFEVSPSMHVGLCSTATTVDLVAPMEVRSEDEVRALAMLAKRLLKRETTIAHEYPGYSYGRDAWLSEAGLRESLRIQAGDTPHKA